MESDEGVFAELMNLAFSDDNPTHFVILVVADYSTGEGTHRVSVQMEARVERRQTTYQVMERLLTHAMIADANLKHPLIESFFIYPRHPHRRTLWMLLQDLFRRK